MIIPTRVFISVRLTMFLAAMLLMVGCGNADRQDAADAGCPSGTYFAQSTDRLVVSTLPDVSMVSTSTSNGHLTGVSFLPQPSILVTDSKSVPKNDVCVVLTTDGIWWTNSNYDTQVIGTGSQNRIVTKTNGNGIIELYWTTYGIPLSTRATNSTSAGTDVTYNSSDIGVSSGALSATISAKITALGCPKETATDYLPAPIYKCP